MSLLTELKIRVLHFTIIVKNVVKKAPTYLFYKIKLLTVKLLAMPLGPSRDHIPLKKYFDMLPRISRRQNLRIAMCIES